MENEIVHHQDVRMIEIFFLIKKVLTYILLILVCVKSNWFGIHVDGNVSYAIMILKVLLALYVLIDLMNLVKAIALFKNSNQSKKFNEYLKEGFSKEISNYRDKQKRKSRLTHKSIFIGVGFFLAQDDRYFNVAMLLILLFAASLIPELIYSWISKDLKEE